MSEQDDREENREDGEPRIVQSHFPELDRETTARRALERAAERDYSIRLAMTSGGKNSLAAADAAWRWGDDYGVAPEAVVHINTGAGLECTREVVREFAAERDLAYIEELNREGGEMLAHRVLEYGFPSGGQGSSRAGGHWPEWVNRKDRVFDATYMGWPGDHLWFSGAFHAESDRRAVNVGDGAVDFGETGKRKPRRTWCSPVHGWVPEDFEDHIAEFGIPKTPAYDWLGYSGDCVACAFDDPRVLNEIRILQPSLAATLERLIGWVYLRARSGRVDYGVHRSVWGWPPEIEDDGEPEPPAEDADQRDLAWAGCASCSKMRCYDG